MAGTSTYQFGSFTLYEARRELHHDGAVLALGSRAIGVLLQLVSRAGEIVSKEALLTAVWDRQAVEENNLTVQISTLRRILGTASTGVSFIRTVPGRGYVFVASVQRTAEAAAAPAEMPPPRSPVTSMSVTSMPPLSVLSVASPLIGRDAELSELRALLAKSRLVCVTGVGGVGKTRIVSCLSAQMADAYADGVVHVDLAPVSDPTRVTDLVATAFGAGAVSATAETALAAALRTRRGLLVLDNAEHLTGAVRRLVRLVLADSAGMSVLVTSREILGVHGESIFRLPPLPAPPESEGATASAALGYGAVRLFAERAKAVSPGFILDDTVAAPVSEICRRLDGIALAIEMVVPRLLVLTPQQIAVRLDERFRLLAPSERDALPRQRTLRTMFDWSWNLLIPRERSLLQRLAVFAGSAGLGVLTAMGEARGESEWDTLDGLTALVEKSLVIAEPHPADVRYRLLESTRQYALDRLPPGEETPLRRQHALSVAEAFARAELEWPTTPGPVWLARHGPDADNLRAAFDWACGADGDTELALRLAAASYPLWWELSGLPLREARRWFDWAVVRIGPQTPVDVQARLWLGHGWRDARFGDRENYPAVSRAAELFRIAGEPVGQGAALWRAGSTMMTHETAAEARALFAEAEALLRTQTPGKWLAMCLLKRADMLARDDEADAAFAAYAEAMQLVRRFSHWYGLMNCSSNMAELLFRTGAHQQALAQLQGLRDELPPGLRSPAVATLAAHLALAGQPGAAMDAAREVVSSSSATGLIGALAWAAEVVALLRVEAGDPVAAARLAGFAQRVHFSPQTRFGSRRDVFLQLDAALAAALDPGRCAALKAEGAAWSEAEAIAAAEAACMGPTDAFPPQSLVSRQPA